MIKYVVKQGDCLLSISEEHGFFWKTIWNHPENEQLRRKRGNPTVIYPGDVVSIPEKQPKEVSRPTEKRHRFRRRGVPAFLRLQVLDSAHKPRPILNYTLNIDGVLLSGKTDGDGRIKQTISPTARHTILTLNDQGKIEEYELPLGHIDPITEISGVQQRLINLGFDCAPVDGELGEKTRVALRAFQKKVGIQDTGEPDEITRERLKKTHGC